MPMYHKQLSYINTCTYFHYHDYALDLDYFRGECIIMTKRTIAGFMTTTIDQQIDFADRYDRYH